MHCIICSERVYPKPNLSSEERTYVWNESREKNVRSISLVLFPFHYPVKLCYAHEKMASGLLVPYSQGAFIDYLRAKRVISGFDTSSFAQPLRPR